jgi:hypothetical protein
MRGKVKQSQNLFQITLFKGKNKTAINRQDGGRPGWPCSNTFAVLSLDNGVETYIFPLVGTIDLALLLKGQGHNIIIG